MAITCFSRCLVTAICAWMLTPCSFLSAQNEVRGLGWHSDAIRTDPLNRGDWSPVISNVCLQPGGNLVAAVGDDHVVNLYDRTTGRLERHLIEHTDWVRTAHFSPNGRLLATAGNDHQLLLWNLENQTRPTKLAEHAAAITSLAFSSDSTKIATVGFESTLRIYDVASGRLNSQMDCECGDMRTVSFSTDGRWVAAAGRSGRVHVWEIATGRLIADVAMHRRRIRSLVFTQDNHLITCSDDGMVKIGAVDRLEQARSLPAHGGKLFAVCVLPDGILATGGSDNLIYLWNLEDLTALGVLTGHTGSITSLDFDGNTLVSGSYDTYFRLWKTEAIARKSNLLLRR